MVASLLVASASAVVAQTELLPSDFCDTAMPEWSALDVIVPSGAPTHYYGDCMVATATDPSSGLTGLPATDGTKIFHMGFTLDSATSGLWSQYRDVAVPAGVTRVTLSADVGLKFTGGMPADSNTGITVGIWDPAADTSTAAAIAEHRYTTTADDSTLVHVAVPDIDLSAYAGRPIRVAFNIYTSSTTGSGMAAIDNLHLLAYTGTPSPTPVPPTLALALLGLAGASAVPFGRRFQRNKTM